MIHHVIEEVDRGAPIITKEIGIKSDDSLEDLRVSGVSEDFVTYPRTSASRHHITKSICSHRGVA